MTKSDILSLDREELREKMVFLGEKPFRADQIFKWIQNGYSFDEMTNISKELREKLKENFEIYLPEIEKKLTSGIDGTVKYLFSLHDGEKIESVLMKYKYGNTVCVSSQAGCRMGCRFCASTLRGKSRDLEPSEILGQVIAAAKDSGERVHGIVVMGIGEPFDNYGNVIKFLRLAGKKDGLGIGMRHISVSTCGIVPGILALAEEGLPVTLSISLHHYDNEKRSEIMPVTNKYPIEEVLAASKTYFEKTGRRVSFEYTLISGKNDSREDAENLAFLLKKTFGVPSHINLIMLNEVAETKLSSPQRDAARKFEARLLELGQNATIRRRLGSDINASCGQLRLGT